MVDSKPDTDAEERVASVFRRLVELRSEPPMLFRFDRDAQELFYEWYSELQSKVRDDSIHPALASHLSKYASLMPSLALNSSNWRTKRRGGCGLLRPRRWNTCNRQLPGADT